MYSVLWLAFAVAALILIIHLPLRFEIHHLPGLFSDEPELFVEQRQDWAKQRDADESYQLRTLRACITYSKQHNSGVLSERFEITYRGKPGPMLELDDGYPTYFGIVGLQEDRRRFLLKELRDIQVFAHHVRICVERCRTQTL